jgi:hypothetical protein
LRTSPLHRRRKKWRGEETGKGGKGCVNTCVETSEVVHVGAQEGNGWLVDIAQANRKQCVSSAAFCLVMS